MPSHRRYLASLSVVYAALWIALAIDPYSRHDWALENVLVVVGVFVVWLSHRRLLLSRVSYTLIFVFLCLHAIGAHHTYSLVPYDEWWQGLTGHSLNEQLGWERNHFDRVVHFLYGLLLAYPVRELMFRVADVRGFWGYFFPVALTMASSALYELIEWVAAVLFGGDLGVAFLGTQGDVWDGQKDMALATLGALLAMIVTALLNRAIQRDFAKEWSESLRVKHPDPLGEDEIRRLIEESRVPNRD